MNKAPKITPNISFPGFQIIGLPNPLPLFAGTGKGQLEETLPKIKNQTNLHHVQQTQINKY